MVKASLLRVVFVEQDVQKKASSEFKQKHFRSLSLLAVFIFGL